VFAVTNPAAPVRVGGCATRGVAWAVAVSGRYACVADGEAGLFITDVSDPANCVPVGAYATRGEALGLAVADSKIYLADGAKGLQVLCTIPNAQTMLRVSPLPDQPCSIEATPALGPAAQWSTVFTTNASAGAFDYTDFDVKVSQQPHKFYRLRQP
jgi:hypothetical protein